MSRRPRKTNRQNVSFSVMESAKKLLEEGKSKRGVAQLLGIHEATLRKRLKMSYIPQSLGRFKNTFAEEMELELNEHVKMLDSMFYGITAKNFRVLTYEFAEKMTLTINSIENQRLSERNGTDVL